MESSTNLLEEMQGKGIQLWLDQGALRYKAPRGSVSPADLEKIRTSRNHIIQSLQRSAREARAPLAFSQLAHWHLYRLSERPAIRQVAEAKRLMGPLDLESLKRALKQLVIRHDALRTRIVVSNDTPFQEVLESCPVELQVVDLRITREDQQEAEILRQIDKLILHPIVVTTDPLWAIRLLQIREDVHVVIVAMEHLIADAASLGVFFRDLFLAYRQTLTGRSVSLPALQIQFVDHALSQQRGHASWLEKHGAYWTRRLAGFGRLKFPEDPVASMQRPSGWGTIPIRIESGLKSRLVQTCRQLQTTLALGVLTAYVAAVSRWCGSPEVVVQFQTDGRMNPQVLNAIGYFACVLHLRIDLGMQTDFCELIHRVRDEYFQAYEHADESYLEAQLPRPQVARNCAFNWVPRLSDDKGLSEGFPEGTIECSSVPFAHPMLNTLDRDNEPVMLLYDVEDGITGYLYFPRDRFSVKYMTGFAQSFLLFAERLSESPESALNSFGSMES